MIDFRYHLVSIVSVFLALAVGIVLGAGPLKGQLGDTISKEVTTLRSDKADLNAQLASARAATAARDDYDAATLRTVLVGRLAGQQVDLVLLPGADAGLARTIRATLVEAGAAGGDTVTIDSSWVSTDAGDVAKRDQLAASLAASLSLSANQDQTVPLIDRVLAAALKPATPDPQKSRTQALREFADAGLLSLDTATPVAPDAVVVLGAPVSGDDPAVVQEQATDLARIAAAVDRVSLATVVATNEGVATLPAGAVGIAATVRANTSLSRGVSTVDDVGVPMGRATVALALLEQATGASGQYGLGNDASAVFPVIAGITGK